MEKERRGMRFGGLAVGKGFITPEQLYEALRIQVEENLAKFKHRRIGMILLEQDLINLEQIDEILMELNG